MDIDLFGAWPTLKHRGDTPTPESDPARATVLDSPLYVKRIRRADPNRVRDLLSQLITAIEGKPLSAFVPMAETVPLLLGLTPGNLAAFDEFLGAFIGTVVGDLGRVVTPGSVTSPADSISANRRRLAAGSLGVQRTAVEPGRPATAQKFDELMAMFSEGRTLAAVLGDGNDGLPPGVSEIVNSMLIAIRNGLVAGDAEGARQAGADAGVLISAVHATFFGGETSERSANCNRLQLAARTHTGGLSGMVRVRKAPADSSRARIVAVEMEGVEYVVDQRTGKLNKRKKKLTKVR